MFEDPDAAIIWDRVFTGDLTRARLGDGLLVIMQDLHGGAMNGGLLHAVGKLDAEELAAAQASYGYFGLTAIADLLAEAADIFKRGDDLDDWEIELDRRYHALVPSDDALLESLKQTLRRNPSGFAPI